MAPWHGVIGINYHRIGDGRRSVYDRGLWSATVEDLDAQLRWLKAHVDVIEPADIPRALRSKRGRHAVVTFDDGYRDNYTDALPVLLAHRVKATFFITTGFIDSPRVPFWDEIAWMVRTGRNTLLNIPGFFPAPLLVDEPEREHAIRRLLKTWWTLPTDRTSEYLLAIGEATGSGRLLADTETLQGNWMTWDMVRGLHASGMTIGGHTVNHPIMARLSREQQMTEITGCERRLREELGIAMQTFAYPFGARDAFNADSRECLQERGVLTAFSYYGGIRKTSAWEDLDIPRFAVEQSTSLAEFRANVMFPWTT